MSYQVSVFTSFEEFRSAFAHAGLPLSISYSSSIAWIGEEWKALKRIRSLGKAFGKRYLLAAVFQGDVPVLAAPLYIKGSEAGIVGSESPTDVRDFTVFTGCDSNAIRALLDYLKVRGVSTLRLESVPFDSPSIALLKDIPGVIWEPTAHNDPMISGFESSKQWWNSIKKKVRSNIQYAERKLTKTSSEYEFACYESPFDAFALKCAERMHSKRVRQIERRPEERKAFRYKLLEFLTLTGVKSPVIKMASEDGVPGRLYVLWIGGKCAAAIIGFYSCDSKRFQIPFLGFDPNFKSFAPGILLSRYMIQKELDEGRDVDFMLGDEKYKFDLGSTNFYFARCTIKV